MFAVVKDRNCVSKLYYLKHSRYLNVDVAVVKDPLPSDSIAGDYWGRSVLTTTTTEVDGWEGRIAVGQGESRWKEGNTIRKCLLVSEG